jgi:anaerobic selenocysteine-containing dehydrogenase
MPGMYPAGEYDLAGFAVGVVEKSLILTGKDVKAGDVVDITSHWNDQKHRVAHKFIVVDYPIPPKCVATYFPETNVLVPIDSVADTSNTPTSKSIIVSLSPHRATRN